MTDQQLDDEAEEREVARQVYKEAIAVAKAEFRELQPIVARLHSLRMFILSGSALIGEVADEEFQWPMKQVKQAEGRGKR